MSTSKDQDGWRLLMVPVVLTCISVAAGVAVWIWTGGLRAEAALLFEVVLVAAVGVLLLEMALVAATARAETPFIWYKAYFKHGLMVGVVGVGGVVGLYFGRSWILSHPWVCVDAFLPVHLFCAYFTARKYAYLSGIAEETYDCRPKRTEYAHPLDWADAGVPVLVLSTISVAAHPPAVVLQIAFYAIIAMGLLISVIQIEGRRRFAMDSSMVWDGTRFYSTWLSNAAGFLLKSLSWVSLTTAWLGVPLLFTMMLPPATWRWWAWVGCVAALLVPLWISRIRAL